MDFGSPFFSVIMPTYNRGHCLYRSIDSVLTQDFIDFELIIVDDGSTDDTQLIVENVEDKRIRYFKIDNSERGAARNIGIRAAIGKYITFLDSDDVLYHNYLKTGRQLVTEREFPEIFRTAFEIKDQHRKVLERSTINSQTVNDTLIYGNIMACLGVFIKSNIAKNFLFVEDRRLAGTEDYELWLRIGSRFPIWNDNSITAAIIQHSQRSVVNQNIKLLEERICLFIDYVFSDAQNKTVYDHKNRLFVAMRYSYIALHASVNGEKKIAVKYLLRAIGKHPLFFLYKRFYVIIYKLLF